MAFLTCLLDRENLLSILIGRLPWPIFLLFFYLVVVMLDLIEGIIIFVNGNFDATGWFVNRLRKTEV